MTMASDVHGDKRSGRNQTGPFIDPLDLVFRDIVDCIQIIYGNEKYFSSCSYIRPSK